MANASPMPIWTELVCRQCAATGHGEFTRYQRNRTQLRREALASGWLFVRDHAFCSLSCVRTYEEKEAANA